MVVLKGLEKDIVTALAMVVLWGVSKADETVD